MTQNRSPTWGVVTTAKAPLDDILNFCAHHLSIGAHRIYLYLDDGDAKAAEILSRHPRMRVFETDAAWWAKRGRRPEKHQVRQSTNVRHACNRRQEVDWLAHIDIDELLWPAADLGETLGALDHDVKTARVRPAEALAHDPAHPTDDTCFKCLCPDRDTWHALSAKVFPQFGQYLNSGFLSHVQGKVFIRMGLGMVMKIHNAYLDDIENPNPVELDSVRLLHLHAESWDQWRARFDYRLSKGSYRSELKPPIPAGRGGVPLHDLFQGLLEDQGEAGLRAFYTEICQASPDVITRLQEAGLLFRCNMGLLQKRISHFPNPVSQSE